MKKIIALLLAIVVCLCISACSGRNDIHETEASTELTTMTSPTENTVPAETEPQYTTTEITLDNWQEYFEIVLAAYPDYNAFGEFIGFSPDWRFCLKEQYAEVATDIDVAVEYSCTNGNICTYSYNLDTEELVVGEPDSGLHVNDVTEIFTLNDITTPYASIYIIFYGSGGVEIEGNIATRKASKFENIDILRIQGSLTIID